MSLTRSKPLTRTGIARGRKRLNPVNRRRRTDRHARNFGDEAALVRSLGCLVCGGLSDPAHVVSRGASGGRFDLVPLCRAHHDEQHRDGVETFAARHGLDLRAEADRVALLHAPPLGVRGLVHQWAFDRNVDDVCTQALRHATRGQISDEERASSLSSVEGLRNDSRLDKELTDYERAALLGWVRRRMARAMDAAVGLLPAPLRIDHAKGIAAALGLAYGQARALCGAAGWPS